MRRGVGEELPDLQVSLFPSGARLHVLPAHAPAGRPRTIPRYPALRAACKKYRLPALRFVETASAGSDRKLQPPCHPPIRLLARLADITAETGGTRTFSLACYRDD